MFPTKKLDREVLVEQLFLYEQPDNTSPEHFHHGIQSAERDVEERSLVVKATLEETIGYIDHGLEIVDYSGSLFSDNAKMEICRRTGGNSAGQRWDPIGGSVRKKLLAGNSFDV